MMRGHAAGCIVAATYALGTNAFLFPPGVNSIDESLASLGDKSTKTQSIRIPCAECAFSTKQAHAEGDASEDDGVYRIEGGANELLFHFTTSEDNKRLELNGAAIYPPLDWSREESEVVVHQVPAGAEDVKVPLRVTSSGLITDVVRPDDDDAAASVVTLRYTVLGVEKQLMQLQDVKIDLLQTGDELLIMKVESDEDDRPPMPQHHGPPGFHPHHGPPGFHGPPPETFRGKCNMLPAPVCRFKHMLEVKMARLRNKKPCPGRKGPPHGRLPSHIRPPGVHGEHPHAHHGRPHHTRPWHGHPHRHHNHHRLWAGAFMRGFIAVLIPVAAGISVGLTVSLLGLLLGRLLAMIWYRCTGRGQQRAREAALVEEGEGKGLMVADEDDDEELPAYEDAPPYEECDARVSK